MTRAVPWLPTDILAANALAADTEKLRAAAPELLRALLTARDTLLGVMMEPDRNNALHTEWRARLASIDAAIAKATGGAA